MKYKISDDLLKLREYGRNVQMMVDYARTLEDRPKRQALIEEIVRIMANLNPAVREKPDYQHILWDHVFHLGEYNLDIDAPFEVPPPGSHQSRPKTRMGYYIGRPRYRQYGKNVDLMLKEAFAMEDKARQLALIELVANIMRIQLTSSDKDHNAELTTIEHLKIMLKGHVELEPNSIKFWETPPPKLENHYPKPASNKKRKKKNNNSNNNNNNNNNRNRK